MSSWYMLLFYVDGALHAIVVKEASDHYPWAYVVFYNLNIGFIMSLV